MSKTLSRGRSLSSHLGPRPRRATAETGYSGTVQCTRLIQTYSGTVDLLQTYSGTVDVYFNHTQVL